MGGLGHLRLSRSTVFLVSARSPRAVASRPLSQTLEAQGTRTIPTASLFCSSSRHQHAAASCVASAKLLGPAAAAEWQRLVIQLLPYDQEVAV